MEKTKKIRLFNKVKKKLETLDSVEALRRNKLNLVDVEMLYRILPKVFNSPDEKAYCLAGTVADWCKKAGLKVTEPHNENEYTMVNYTISLE